MSPTFPHRPLRVQSDARLLLLARRGDAAAFEALVRRYRRQLHGYCRRLSLGDAQAEDALQQGLLHAWRALCRGDDVHDVKGWMYRVVHNAALDALRRAGNDNVELDEGVHGTVEVSAAGELDRRLAVHATLTELAALPRMQREALVRTAVHGDSHEQVASALGLSHDAVRGLVHRARTAMRAAAGALVPGRLLQWLMRCGAGAGVAGAPELGAGGPGGDGMFAVLAKSGAILATSGVLAGSLVAVQHVHLGHHRSAARRDASASLMSPSGASGSGTAGGSAAAMGSGTAVGYGTAIGYGTAMGSGTAMGDATATGSVAAGKGLLLASAAPPNGVSVEHPGGPLSGSPAAPGGERRGIDPRSKGAPTARPRQQPVPTDGSTVQRVSVRVPQHAHPGQRGASAPAPTVLAASAWPGEEEAHVPHGNQGGRSHGGGFSGEAGSSAPGGPSNDSQTPGGAQGGNDNAGSGGNALSAHVADSSADDRDAGGTDHGAGASGSERSGEQSEATQHVTAAEQRNGQHGRALGSDGSESRASREASQGTSSQHGS